jgi:SAM-dependent methyltransferase
MGRYQFQHEYSFISRFLATLPSPRRILDLGCGSGRMTLPLSHQGFKMTGLDIEPAALAAFPRESHETPLVRGDATRLPFAARSFDCVVALQAVDYVDHRLLLNECHRVLTPGGGLIFDAPNLHSYKWGLKRVWDPNDSLTSTIVSCRELLRSMPVHGFTVQAVRGYNWIPFSRKSNSALIRVAASLEQALRLHRFYIISPKILLAARKAG